MAENVRIRLEGDQKVATDFIAEGTVILRKAEAVARSAGVGMFAKTARLADGVTAYALFTPTQSIVHITALTSRPQTSPKTEFVSRPDFLSGVVRGGVINIRAKTSGGSVGGWDMGTTTEPGNVAFLEMFKPTIKCAQRLKLGSGYQPSQRLAVEPPKWYDIFPQPDERTYPSQYYRITPSCYSGQMKKLVQYVLGLGRLSKDELLESDPLADEVAADGFTMRYDFRWQRTHGLVKAADKRWWLIEISQANGVLAMPLPLYPDVNDADTTVLDNEQPEMADVVAAFGGQPTGETFPYGKELTAAIAAGDILQPLKPEDVAEFYGYSPYSTMLGWAFSSDGHEAHNTGHTVEDYTDGRSIGVGVHYRITFSIGPLKTQRDANEPIADMTAGFTRQSRGYLDRPGKKTGVQFHTPEPMLEAGGMMTYDFPQRLRRVRCDTTVHVFFIDKELQMVRYYQDPKSLPAHIDGNVPSGCGMLSGSYAWTVYGAGGNVPAQFYTNRFDYREKIAPSMSYETYSASPGAFSGPLINDHLDNVRYATITRYRVIRIKASSQNMDGAYAGTYIACPYGAREAYVLYHVAGTISSSSSRSWNTEALDDPNSGISFRYFYHKKPPEDTSCYDQDVRRIQSLAYNPYPCSDIADAGQWLSECQIISEGGNLPGGGSGSFGTTPKATAVCESFLVAATDFQQYALKSLTSDRDRWETKSPDEFGNVKHFDCVFSALGEQHAVFNQRISTSPPPEDYVTYGSLHKKGDSGFFSYLGVL